MSKRRIYDAERHAQFITFSCYHRRQLLDHPLIRDELVTLLSAKLVDYSGICSGFVIMPDHVHAIIWFAEPGVLSRFMKSWKQTSSIMLKRVLRGVAPSYASEIPIAEPFWQPKYFPFNLYSDSKAREKLQYMHLNPVRAGLAERPTDWKWSSASYYEHGGNVGVPIEWIFS